MSIGKLAAEKALKDPKGGLTAAGRAHFKRTEGANLKPGVKGPADTPEKMRRKGSFLSRMFGPGAPGAMTKDNGEPSRRALSARAWGEPVPKNDSDRAALYAKGQRLLERYKNQKEGAEAPPWEQENPKKKSKELSDSQKAEAKRRARAAGRPYPNLVDNMAVSKTATNWGATGDILRGIGSHALRGAIPGAFIGGIDEMVNKDPNESTLHAALTGAAKGGVMGGGLGALMGHGLARLDRRVSAEADALRDLVKNRKGIEYKRHDGSKHLFVPTEVGSGAAHAPEPVTMPDGTVLHTSPVTLMRHPELRDAFYSKYVDPRIASLPIYPPRAPKTAFDEGFSASLNKFAAELTAKGRAQVKSFAIPEEKKYPIHDAGHARNALARVSQFGSADEKARVRAAVNEKYPGVKQSSALSRITGRDDPSTVKKITSDPKQLDAGDVANIVGAGALGLYLRPMLELAAKDLLGATPFYHGTTRDAAKSIRETGLDPLHGAGEGGGAQISGNSRFVRDSKGRVHAAKGLMGKHLVASPHASLAGAYEEARAAGKELKGSALEKAFLKGILTRGSGDIVEGAMPSSVWRKLFEQDPDHIPSLAFRGQTAVDPKYISGGRAGLFSLIKNREPELLKYLKENPARAARGAAVLALPAAAAGYGIYSLLND